MKSSLFPEIENNSQISIGFSMLTILLVIAKVVLLTFDNDFVHTISKLLISTVFLHKIYSSLELDYVPFNYTTAQ